MKHFLSPDEEQAVVAAIRHEETRTSAEIRVCVTYRRLFRMEPRAWKVFRRLGMARTRERNGVLIFVVPRRRKFLVIGDEGADRSVPDGFWRHVAAAITAKLREGDHAGALVTGIHMLGDELSKTWPPSGDNPDELPNDIIHDG